MTDLYETIVRWYLRFNGYFCVENFVVHEPDHAGVPQGAEFDTLAVRFPHSKEIVSGQPIENDPRLNDGEVSQSGLIDFVIAEVKSGKRLGLNRIWREENTRNLERLAYMVRWLGGFEEESLSQMAQDLLRNKRAVAKEYCIRLVVFGHRTSQQAVPSHVPQITFTDIANFIVRVRAPCWTRYQLGVRSAHDQWDPLIKSVWDIADRAERSEEKVQAILHLLHEYAPPSNQQASTS